MPGRRKGRDDSDMGSEKDETGSFETLRDEAMYFVHVQLYQKAVESFTRASEMNPEDNVVLVTRAKCYLQLGMAENALADAEQALSHDKDYIRGLLMKAEALYQLGHFETALVFFHRGHKLRQELGEFRLGIQKAQEAINNSIGSPSSVKLDTTGDLSFFEKQENPVIEPEPPSEDETDKTKKAPAKSYGKPGAQKATQKERERPKSAADSKTIKQLLEELYCDKTYLEKLLNDENLTGGRSYMEREIKEHIYEGLDYLNSRADFWRQQKPMYARKRDKERMRRSGRSRPQDRVGYIMQSLEEIDEAQSEGRYETSLSTAKKLMKTVNSMDEQELSNKWEIVANIHSQMGNAYLEMGKYSPAIEHHQEDLKLAEKCGLEDAKSRALDNIGRVYARKGQYEKAIKVWEEKLPLSKSPLEKTWLFHEIGRCYLESENYEKARDYGEKSLSAAQEADDDGWQLHATVLVAQSEVKSMDYQSAHTSFEEALELAKRLEDDAALTAVQKALEEVKDKIAKGYRAGEDEDEGDEVDAKKVDYRPGEDADDRKSAQSRDSKKVKGAEDEDNEGRKSRASSKADYEDDFEEDKAVVSPIDGVKKNNTPTKQVIGDKEPGHHRSKESSVICDPDDCKEDGCNENELQVVGIDSKSVNDTAKTNVTDDEIALTESPISPPGKHIDADTCFGDGGKVDENREKQQMSSVNSDEMEDKEDPGAKSQENQKSLTETDISEGTTTEKIPNDDVNVKGNSDKATHSENHSTRDLHSGDQIQEIVHADKESKDDDNDDGDVKKTSQPEVPNSITANAKVDESGNNENGKQNQDNPEFQPNRNHPEELQFKYINDTTGSRPGSKDSRASPSKSGKSQHKHVVVEDPVLKNDTDSPNASKVKDKKTPKGMTSQQDTRKIQTRSKSSELSRNVKPREKVIKQKSMEETLRIRKASNQKNATEAMKESKQPERTIDNQAQPASETHAGKSKENERRNSDAEVDERRHSPGKKTKTVAISDITRDAEGKVQEPFRNWIPQKQKSADNVKKRRSSSKEPRRKSDISPYGVPAVTTLLNRKATVQSPVLNTQRSQTSVTKSKRKSNDSVRSDSSPGKISTRRSTPDKSRDTLQGYTSPNPIDKAREKKIQEELAVSKTSFVKIQEKSLATEPTGSAYNIVEPDVSPPGRDGVKEEIIDKAPTSPTRRSEGSGRRSVQTASPQKRSPIHSPTKRSLAGSPTKRSAQPSPSKMSQSSRRQTYSPTKQSREVSFKEGSAKGSAKGSMKGSAKGSAGGRSAPGSAQQRASPAAGSVVESARGSAKGSVGGISETKGGC
ncbi:muscle M-line assembly protein unc-89-like [Ylistrum balloti]|uniref:muscle M-line assembly protein unc-89-like n=1 Tax=Ylistrum balloti TaxID=509963 RepID=UPI002905B046|nr:muscle M-line assembly protein unc-89-like [Ylistrum balloti]